MFFIIADISFNTLRSNPVTGNAYQPILEFSPTLLRSGLIVLEEREVLPMGAGYRNRRIGIYSYQDIDPVKEFYVGRPFLMKEGGFAYIGQGVITGVEGEITAPA
jgi:hypothetical protein